MIGGTYFSGGEGVGVAMRAAGIEHAFGVEFNPLIAETARANGFNVLTANVCDVDPAALPYVDLFHASPVCKNASTAKADGKESPEDIATAEAVCRYIEHHRPRVFTLENVWGYRKFDAFQGILKTLTRCGYKWDYWHLNSANYSVPQTRERLILVASLTFQPKKPRATHTEKPVAFFETLKKWVGWYESIEDLIPTLPLAQKRPGVLCPSDPNGNPCRQSSYCRGHFSKWQLERLPEDITQNLPVNSAFPTSNGKKHYGDNAPAYTVDSLTLGHASAFIVGGLHGGTRDAGEPFNAVVSDGGSGTVGVKAFIAQVQGEGGDGIRNPEEQMQSITAAHGADKYRAFIVDGKLGSYSTNMTTRDGGEPFPTVTTSHNNRDLKAFLVNESSTMEVRHAPAATQIANGRNGGQGQRAWLAGGRVVKMTPRALARFQSLPDSYVLPAKTSLACEIIGNMVPPKLYAAVLESIYAIL